MKGKLLDFLKWGAIIPAVAAFWGQFAAVVYFIDWVEFAREVVTPENLTKYEQLMIKVDQLWMDYEHRQGVE